MVKKILLIIAPIIVIALSFSAYGQRPFTTPANFALLQDFETGTILYNKNADKRMYPASMTKIMTAYVLFQELKLGRFTLRDRFTTSRNAYAIGGSRMFLEIGEQVQVEDIIRGIIVQSGNDASVAAAENISGSEAAFSDVMNATAKKLGMEDSNFINASGWPDDNHYTTAMDLLLLARATIKDFPEYYPYYAEREFVYAGIRQANRNPLFGTGLKVDGLKTGHTEASGYGLTASVVVGDRRLIMVVNGLDSKAARAKESYRLIEWGIRNFDNYQLLLSGDTVHTAPVHLGVEDSVPLVIREDVLLSLARDRRAGLKAQVIYNEPLQAPVNTNTPIGTVQFSVNDEVVGQYPIYAMRPIDELSFFGKISRYFSRLRKY